MDGETCGWGGKRILDLEAEVEALHRENLELLRRLIELEHALKQRTCAGLES